jgi:hypothetical protein
MRKASSVDGGWLGGGCWIYRGGPVAALRRDANLGSPIGIRAEVATRVSATREAHQEIRRSRDGWKVLGKRFAVVGSRVGCSDLFFQGGTGSANAPAVNVCGSWPKDLRV